MSIAFVLVAHVWPAGVLKEAVPLGALGPLGVRIFFVISGFLITTLLLDEHAARGTIDLTRFYTRRTLRIFPACYLYLAVIATLSAAHVLVLQPYDLALAATYTMSYAPSPSWWVSHLWSLSCEEQFYLLWPVILAFLGPRVGRRVAWAAVLGAPLFRGLWWACLPEHRMMLGRAFPTVIDAMATGCLCALESGRWTQWARRLRGGHLWLVALVVIALAVIPQNQMPDVARRAFRVPFDTVSNTLIAAWLMGAVHATEGLMTRALNWAPMVALGTVSYSLYLWQELFAGLPGVGPAVQVLASLAAAIASYRLVERPLTALRRRLRPPVSEAAA